MNTSTNKSPWFGWLKTKTQILLYKYIYKKNACHIQLSCDVTKLELNWQSFPTYHSFVGHDLLYIAVEKCHNHRHSICADLFTRAIRERHDTGTIRIDHFTLRKYIRLWKRYIWRQMDCSKPSRYSSLWQSRRMQPNKDRIAGYEGRRLTWSIRKTYWRRLRQLSYECILYERINSTTQ